MPEKKVLRIIGADKEKYYKERIAQLEQTVKNYQKSIKKEEAISNSYIEKLLVAEKRIRELECALSFRKGQGTA